MNAQEVAYRPSDEINLLDLWRVLVSQKKTIVIVTLMVTLLGVVYALFAPKVYKVETYLLPPLEKQIQGIQSVQSVQGVQGVQIVKGKTVDSVYAQFLTNLRSRDLRKKIFQSSHMLEYMVSQDKGKADINRAFEKFNQKLQMLEDKKNKGLVTLAYEFGDPDVAAGVVNDLVALAANKTVSDLIADAESEINNRKKSIRNRIASKRSLAKQNRLDRINALKEAVLIAKQLNLENTDRLQSYVNATDVKTSLYLMGQDALMAELTVLKSRKNDDSFIPGLRDLQERLALLEGINISLNRDKVFAVRVDQKAFAPKDPIKPKKALIVVLSLLLGLMLGVSTAFVRNAILKYAGSSTS